MGIVYLTTNNINGRKYIGVDSQNNKNYFGSGKLIKLALKKYGFENFTKECIEEHEDVEYLFQREKYYIELYDAIKSEKFYNLVEGGKGGSGTLASDESKEIHRLNTIKSLKLLESRKGKTYEEIYGDKADEEKEKRKLAGLGKKYSDERIKNISTGLKGNIPWNKGKKGVQVAWNKGLKGIINTNFKKYTLILPDNSEIIFNNRTELCDYIKNINLTLKYKNKINVVNLIKNRFDREYNIKIASSKS